MIMAQQPTLRQERCSLRAPRTGWTTAHRRSDGRVAQAGRSVRHIRRLSGSPSANLPERGGNSFRPDTQESPPGLGDGPGTLAFVQTQDNALARWAVRHGRLTGSVVLVAVLGGFLTACSGAPSTEELEGAEDARAAGMSTLASVEIPTLSGWSAVAERNVDACGSNTSDQAFDEFHIEGYSCAAVRRTVYRLDGASGLSEDAEAFRAMSEIQPVFAEIAEVQDAPGINISEVPPTADGFVVIDGDHVRVSAYVMPAESVDIDVLPLWHKNATIGEDDGALSAKLGDEPEVGDELLVVTTTVTYFNETREDE